ncbi:MAG: hypothetical protein PHG73_01160 [Pygmaiobacter sp.]|nr:hypothetical protein [Pygmaiobacter sp.]
MKNQVLLCQPAQGEKGDFCEQLGTVFVPTTAVYQCTQQKRVARQNAYSQSCIGSAGLRGTGVAAKYIVAIEQKIGCGTEDAGCDVGNGNGSSPKRRK